MVHKILSLSKLKRLPLIILPALAFLLLSYSSAFAAGNISITRANPDPSSKNNTWFNFVAQPGKTIEDTVLIKNLGPEPVQVKIFAIDSKTNRAGRFIPKLANEAQENIGKWTSLDLKIAELGAYQSVPINFQIALPADLKAGEYSGGIVVEEMPAQCNEKDSNCLNTSLVTTRIGNRIYIKVPGNTEDKLDWLKFEKRQIDFDFGQILNNEHYFDFRLQNKGNTVVRPNVVIEIYSTIGAETKIRKVLGEFQPSAVSEPSIKWEKCPFFGRFTAKASLYINDNQVITKEIIFWVIPWEMLALLAIIASVFAIIFLGYKKTKRSK